MSEEIPDLVQDAETRIFKVKPFGLEESINMRELNPNGMTLTFDLNRHG